MHDHLVRYKQILQNSDYCNICSNRIKKTVKKEILKCCGQEVCSCCIGNYTNCPYCKRTIYDSIYNDKKKVIEIYDEKNRETLKIHFVSPTTENALLLDRNREDDEKKLSELIQFINKTDPKILTFLQQKFNISNKMIKKFLEIK